MNQFRSVNDRVAIIGGSSLGNFYKESPWSCLRRLAYQYLGYKETHPKHYNQAMQLGHKYESQLRDHFSTTYNVECYESDFYAHPDYPFLGGHPDGIFNEDGIIEIKTASINSFYNMSRNGIYESYKDQLTLYMSITERYNAYFVVGCSEDAEEDVVKNIFINEFKWDQDRYNKIIEHCITFVCKLHKELPNRCGERSNGLVSACRTCEFRGLCAPPTLSKKEIGNCI